jgi:hypothetical protein
MKILVLFHGVSRLFAKLSLLSAVAVCAWTASCARGPNATHEGAARASAPPRRLESIAAALEAQGYAPTGSWIEAELSAGSRVTLSLETPRDARIAVIAAGERDEISLDLRILATVGNREIASDVSLGRRAAVSFTAHHGEEYEAIATAIEGGGRAVIAAFEAPLTASPPRIAGLFDFDGGARLGWPAVVEELSAKGYAPASEPVDFEMAEATRRSLSYPLGAGNCYVAVALGSPGVDALALRLFDGNELVSGDFAARYDAWAAVCPERDFEARAAVSGVAGNGTVRVGLFFGPRERLTSWVGPPIRAIPLAETADIELRRAASFLSRRGYGAGEIVATPQGLEPGARLPLPLPAGLDGCYALAASAGGDADVDLRLELTRSGAAAPAVLTDVSGDSISHIAVCHGRGVAAKASVMSLRGATSASVSLFRLPAADVGADAIETDLAPREAAARMARQGLTRLVAEVELEPCGGEFCASLRVDGGACYGAIALSKNGRVERLEARAAGGSGAPSHLGGERMADFAWCPDAGADYAFTAAISGGGVAGHTLAVFADARDKHPSGK